MKPFRIKENSFIAKIAARKLQSRRMAIVVGNCIHLYGISAEKFLLDAQWLRHELKHVEQYERLGFLPFIMKYLWQTMRVGYHRCGLECEAREAEHDETITQKYVLKQQR